MQFDIYIFHSNSVFLTYFYVIRQFGHGTLHFPTSAALQLLFSYGSMSGFGIARNGVRRLWSTRSTPAISGRFTPKIPPFFCSASAFVGETPKTHVKSQCSGYAELKHRFCCKKLPIHLCYCYCLKSDACCLKPHVEIRCLESIFFGRIWDTFPTPECQRFALKVSLFGSPKNHAASLATNPRSLAERVFIKLMQPVPTQPQAWPVVV